MRRTSRQTRATPPVAVTRVVAAMLAAAAVVLSAFVAVPAQAAELPTHAVVYYDRTGDAPRAIDLQSLTTVLSGRTMTLRLNVRDLTRKGRFVFDIAAYNPVSMRLKVSHKGRRVRSSVTQTEYLEDKPAVTRPNRRCKPRTSWNTKTNLLTVKLTSGRCLYSFDDASVSVKATRGRKRDAMTHRVPGEITSGVTTKHPSWGTIRVLTSVSDEDAYDGWDLGERYITVLDSQGRVRWSYDAG